MSHVMKKLVFGVSGQDDTNTAVHVYVTTINTKMVTGLKLQI